MRLLVVSRRTVQGAGWAGEEAVGALFHRAAVSHEVRWLLGCRREAEALPEPAVPVDLSGRGRAAARVALWRATRLEVRAFRPDVVLGTTLAIARTGPPTVCLLSGTAVAHLARGGSRSWSFRVASWGVAAMVVGSEATRDVLIGLGAAPARVVVIPEGLDLDRWCPAEAPPFPTQEPGLLRLVQAGPIGPVHGQHLALDAVARLPSPEKHRVHLHIVGEVADPVYLWQLKDQARGQPVSFHVHGEDLLRQLQRADLALAPSLDPQGTPRAVVRAMACGLPVIWSDQPGHREATRGVGLPVRPGDVDALRAHIRQTLADPEALVRASEVARGVAEGQYGWPAAWARLEALLRHVVGG